MHGLKCKLQVHGVKYKLQHCGHLRKKTASKALMTNTNFTPVRHYRRRSLKSCWAPASGDPNKTNNSLACAHSCSTTAAARSAFDSTNFGMPADTQLPGKRTKWGLSFGRHLLLEPRLALLRQTSTKRRHDKLCRVLRVQREKATLPGPNQFPCKFAMCHPSGDNSLTTLRSSEKKQHQKH